MPTIYDLQARQQLLDRLDCLTPTTAPRLGRMTASQMVAHLLESYRFGAGELALSPWPVPFRRLVRWLGLYVLPFPRGAPAPPGLLARAPRTWDVDVAGLRSAIATFAPPPADVARPTHPVFGTLSDADLGVLAYKHTDHHFRQFGV